MTASSNVNEIIQNLVDRLLAKYSPQQVILFGSYGYGEPQQDSDIDLLIIKETSEPFFDRWVTVRRILSDPTRTIPLEIFVLTPDEVSRRLAAGDQFLEEILERGKVLYAT